MRSSREDIDHVRDILRAAQLAIEFTTGMDRDEFHRDERTSFAVIRAIELVGEASKRVSPDVRADHPDVPWSMMARMRDKLIHDYDDIDLNVVWQTVLDDLPNVSIQIAEVIEQLESEKPGGASQ